MSVFVWKLGQKLGPRGLTALGLVALCTIVGLLGASFVQYTTARLLDAEARIDAERWSSYFSSNVRELQSIAGGATPTRDTRAFLDRSLDGGNLVAYRIYNAEGELRLQSAGTPGLFPIGSPISSIDPAFAADLAEGTPATLLQESTAAGQQRFLASALVPIKMEERTIGWLLVNLDQTERAALFYSIAVQISVGVALLLIAGLAFGFWYRARNRAQMVQAITDIESRDRLTGFLLKPILADRIDARLAKPYAGPGQSALIHCELSDAPKIGQMYGQHAEDQVILAAATRLSTLLAGRGHIAVASRNAFVIFLEDVEDAITALSLAKEITLKLAADVECEGLTLSCACHSGIALSSTDGKTSTLLLRNAEIAMLAAREQGNPGYGFFNPELARTSDRRNVVQRAVAAAVEHGRFRLDFQPVYNIRSGELNGFEALIRLNDPELGNISPAEFIPIAEQAGFINQIGGWALDEACRVAAMWPPHLMVAVNLSPAQFMSGTLIADVRRALSNNQFPSYRLEVEITEGTLLNDSELVLGQLRVLRDMGVAVALDDFGTGYSSLSYLWKFPFSKLKIDRSFVNALDESASAKGILRSIVKLGHGLGLTVTAEGIENVKQYATLRDLGCDLAQGFLLDRPTRIADLAAIILRNFANGLNRRSKETAGKTAA